MAIKKKGFTLFEALISTLILSIIGSGIASVYIIESGLLSRTAHRLQAINYAQAAAETLLDLGAGVTATSSGIHATLYSMPNELAIGEHSTEPQICIIPDGYFKKHLNGRLRYIITKVSLPMKAHRAEIIVEWDEKFPKPEKMSEHLFIVALYVPK